MKKQASPTRAVFFSYNERHSLVAVVARPEASSGEDEFVLYLVWSKEVGDAEQVAIS